MPNLITKKRFLSEITTLLALLIWQTSKLAVKKTCRWAPKLIRGPCSKIGKPLKTFGETWNKNKNIIQNNYKVLQKYKKLTKTSLLQILRYNEILASINGNVLRKVLLQLKEANKKLTRRGLVGPYKNLILSRTLKSINKYLKENIPLNTKFELYKRVPWKIISRIWGTVNSVNLPFWLRSPTYMLYVWVFGCHLEEAIVQDISKYKNLSEFFRRLLKPGLRPINQKTILTSPADGKVLYYGKVRKSQMEQVKGVTYPLKDFVGTVNFLPKSNQPPTKAKFPVSKETILHDSLVKCKLPSVQKSLLSDSVNNTLHYCVIYLSPGDYHRFHSPTDWFVRFRRHFPGELFSVNPSVARWLKGLFNLNERVMYVGKWIHGFFSMTAVGATNVGSISVYMDKKLRTNCRKTPKCKKYFDKTFQQNEQKGVFMKKGKLFGEFNLGSTIVLLFEAPKSFKFNLKLGQQLKYGQAIAK